MTPFKVEVTSRELIKPSSPTPPHLNQVQLSFLDQFAPPIYIPLMFFYHNEHGNDHANEVERALLLRKSLSDTLVRFYPLAGRAKGNVSIDCNDEGVEFCEANVSTKLMEIIENPNIEDLRGLLPFEPIAHDKNVVLGVQVNNFSCGGICISVCISHKIADGNALVDFVNAWGTMARMTEGDDQVVLPYPMFDGATYFPPRDLNNWIVNMSNAGVCKEKVVTRRFIFDKKMLEALKEQVRRNNNIDGIAQEKAPTRVELVSSYIWKHLMDATRRRRDSNPCLDMTFPAIHAVNLRKRRTNPIPEESFGNFWWFTIALHVSSAGETNEISSLVCKIREDIRKVDNSFIKTLEDGCTEFPSETKKTGVGIEESCRFSSWCRFLVYEVDFGWGKPTWVCTTTMPFKNVVILLSTKCGEGIEAWVNMLQDDIAMMQQHLQLLS